MYLLDTNICIYLMKNAFPSMTKKILAMDPSLLYISSITVFELEYGASKSKWSEQTKTKLAMFLAPFNILPFDSDDAVAAGSVRQYLEMHGMPIGPYDTLIAAQGLSKKLTVITNNTKEFSRIPELTVEDWTV